MLKTVTTELRYAHDVISSGETHSERVADVVDPLLGVFLEGGQINGTGGVQKGITGWIRQEASLAETAEKAHLTEVRKLDQFCCCGSTSCSGSRGTPAPRHSTPAFPTSERSRPLRRPASELSVKASTSSCPTDNGS